MDLPNSQLNAFHRRILNGVTLRSTGTHGRGVPMRVQIIALSAIKSLAELRPSVPLYCSATMEKNNQHWIDKPRSRLWVMLESIQQFYCWFQKV